MSAWGRFCETAYPEEMKVRESHRSLVWKTQRRLGLYAAYVFHHLGVSANLVDVFRALLAVLAVSLLSEYRTNIWIAGFAVLLLYFQVFLDFVDGMVARLAGPMCCGKELDGLPNELSRVAILILLGLYTESTVLIFVSVAISCILVGFLERTTEKIPAGGIGGFVKKVARRPLSVVFMLIVLPAILVTCIGLHVSLMMASYALLGFYAFLTILWLAICTLKE